MQTALFCLFAAILAVNGVPHFVKGVTKQQFPMLFGSGPVANLVAGWAMLGGAGVLFGFAHLDRHPLAGGIALAAGALAMGLFHATVGAFGPRPES